MFCEMYQQTIQQYEVCNRSKETLHFAFLFHSVFYRCPLTSWKPVVLIIVRDLSENNTWRWRLFDFRRHNLGIPCQWGLAKSGYLSSQKRDEIWTPLLLMNGEIWAPPKSLHPHPPIIFSEWLLYMASCATPVTHVWCFRWITFVEIQVYYMCTLRKDFVILQLYWWLFSSTNTIAEI